MSWASEKLHKVHYGLVDQLFYEILTIDMLLEQFDKNLLLQYL